MMNKVILWITDKVGFKLEDNVVYQTLDGGTTWVIMDTIEFKPVLKTDLCYIIVGEENEEEKE